MGLVRGRRPWLLIALALFGLGRGSQGLGAQALATAPTALPVEAPAGLAILIRGPDRLQGLPFFTPNAIPSLRGSYLLGKDELPFWFTREALVFGGAWVDDASWVTKAGGRPLTSRTAGGRIDLALRYPGWSIILELPSADPAIHRFVGAFIDRFTFFLDNAKSDAELSFPATLAY